MAWGNAEAADTGRLFQGAGSAFAVTGAVYLATCGFPARYLATAIGFTQCFGMLGGAEGQFAVAPLIHGVLPWQQFWVFAAAVLTLVVLIATPGGPAVRSAAQGSIWSMFTPYKSVKLRP